MKTETFEFKKLSSELEEVLMEKMITVKGGSSDGFDWQEFYDTHEQGEYTYEDGDFNLQDNEDQPMIIEMDGYDWISFDGGENWGSLLAEDGEVTIEGLGSDIIFEGNDFNLWASDNENFDFSDFFEGMGYITDLGELISERLNNLNASRWFSKLGSIADGLGVAMDISALIDYYKNEKGNMDGYRFSIRTTATGMGIVAGGTVGGAGGVVVGGMVGAMGDGAEFAYDTILNILEDLGGQFHTDFSNGWLPAAG